MNISHHCFVCTGPKEVLVKDEHTGTKLVVAPTQLSPFPTTAILEVRCGDCGLVYSLESIGVKQSD